MADRRHGVRGVWLALQENGGMKSESVRLENRKRLASGRMICGFCAGRHISKIGDGGVQYEGWRRPQLTIQAGFVSVMSSNQVNYCRERAR